MDEVPSNQPSNFSGNYSPRSLDRDLDSDGRGGYRSRKKKKPSRKDHDLLYFSLGQRDCHDSNVDRFIDLYLLAIIAVIVFIVLSLDWSDNCIRPWVHVGHEMADYCWLILFKALIFFLIIYIANLVINKWRKQMNICELNP